MKRCFLVALVLAASLAGCERQPGPPSGSEPSASPAPSAARPPAKSPPAVTGLPDFTPLVEREGPAVVNVVTSRTIRGANPDLEDDPFFDFFRRFLPDTPKNAPPEQHGEGLGSGFIISADGYVLTNAHVITDADDVTVRLADSRREFKAKVVGADERTDVALLKIDATGLPTVTIGSAEQLKVGEWVAAIGSPFGFDNTITAGIVSAKGRALPDESFVPFIQTDVAVNPGNSGGPLLNLRGEVVGINSLIYSRTGGYMGVSFAIPIEVAMKVAKQLQTEGRVRRARLGVRIQEVTAELARSFGLPGPGGALVAGVESGSPAEKAGMLAGDVILKYNGETIDKVEKLPRLVGNSKPGSNATLDIWRNGAHKEVTVTLAELQPERSARTHGAAPRAQQPNSLGLTVRELPPAQRKALGVDYGLVVEDVQSSAADTGIRRGDVILAVNQARFASVEQFNEIIARQKPGSTVALLVRRGDATLYVPMKIGGK
jgi:serine protease Do